MEATALHTIDRGIYEGNRVLADAHRIDPSLER
jgi:hypothetical protein